MFKELKDNYLDDFNKKYNAQLSDKNIYIGFRDTWMLKIGKIDEVIFKELCRINFDSVEELELKFEDNIDISVLTKFSYHDLSFLGLIGKIRDINILNKLPFKSLTTLFLSGNDFSNNDFNIFESMPFNNLTKLIFGGNKINDLKALSKAKFHNLRELLLLNNSISDLNGIELFPFTNLEKLDLDNNLIYNIDYFSEANFPFLNMLILSNNKISNINVFSQVKFKKLKYLILKGNVIEDIEVFSRVPFTYLSLLDLGKNSIKNINVFQYISFKLKELKINNNPINDFRIINNIQLMNGLSLYVDRRQQTSIVNQGYPLTNIKLYFD